MPQVISWSGGRKGLGRKHRNGGRGGWGGLLHPLGKGVARAPGVLAVEEKALAVQDGWSRAGFQLLCVRPRRARLRLPRCRPRSHLADGGFADLKAASAGPGLPHAVRFGQARAGRGLLLRAGRGCGPFAKGRGECRRHRRRVSEGCWPAPRSEAWEESAGAAAAGVSRTNSSQRRPLTGSACNSAAEMVVLTAGAAGAACCAAA